MKRFNHLFSSVFASQAASGSLSGSILSSVAEGTASQTQNNATQLPAGVVPGVIPTGPSPDEIFNQGADCAISWSADPSGLWNETNVELMSGDNWHMVHISTVATFDATDPSKTTYLPLSSVLPNSAIYFYQFSTPAAPKNLTWTGRFAIAAADGTTTSPANTTQRDGQSIPWGVGALKDPSQAVTAPSYLRIGAAGTTSTSARPTATMRQNDLNNGVEGVRSAPGLVVGAVLAAGVAFVFGVVS